MDLCNSPIFGIDKIIVTAVRGTVHNHSTENHFEGRFPGASKTSCHFTFCKSANVTAVEGALCATATEEG